MTKERHMTVTEDGKTYHFWRVRAKQEMPWFEHGNPWLWFGKRDGDEMEVCGVDTLREAKEHFGITT